MAAARVAGISEGGRMKRKQPKFRKGDRVLVDSQEGSIEDDVEHFRRAREAGKLDLLRAAVKKAKESRQ